MDDILEEIVSSLSIEIPLNKYDDKPPFGYFHPQTKGNLIWVCDFDQDQKLVSVFKMKGDSKIIAKYLENVEEALEYRNELVSEGWEKINPPDVNIRLPNGKTIDELNRKEKRGLKKMIKKDIQKYK